MLKYFVLFYLNMVDKTQDILRRLICHDYSTLLVALWNFDGFCHRLFTFLKKDSDF